MPSRIIRSCRGSQVLKDSLTSLFSLEAIKPSSEIYIISPWITNSPLIDNRHHQFSALFPFIETKTVYLSDILLAYAWRGSKVRLICNPDSKGTSEFLNLLGERVEYRALNESHEKGIITENFYLHGSMNITYSGMNINGECIRITTDLSEINSALISARARWEESGS